MTNLAVTHIIQSYKTFSRDFWLSYKTLEAIMQKEEFEKIKTTLMKSKWIDPKIFDKVDKKEFDLKRDEIDSEWKQKSEESKATGIAVHEKIHNLLCTDLSECKRCFDIPTDKYKVNPIEKFLTEDGIFPEFRMEIPLDEEYQLVGIADLIIKDGNNISIIDYKTDEKIETSARFDISKMKKKCFKYPLSKFEDCSLVQYQLQLSLYGWLIKKINPDFNVQSLEIYHIKDGKLKKSYPVEFLEKEIDQLIKWHLKAIRLKKETDKCKELKY